LVNSSISSVLVYHMTIFLLLKWAIKKLDRIRRQWQGSEEARKGSAMVNWKRVHGPKRLGGLGILDLQRFNRALQLWWPWYKCNGDNKPWAGMNITLSKSETALCQACTLIELGNGAHTSF
jgi:hypothetical protein